MSENSKELLANIAPFGLRMQPDIKDRIKEAADANNRSLNAEIVDRLAKSFEGDFVRSDVLQEIQENYGDLITYVKSYAEQLTAAAERERDLHDRLSSLIDALSQSHKTIERLMGVIEKAGDVSQKA